MSKRDDQVTSIFISIQSSQINYKFKCKWEYVRDESNLDKDKNV